HLMSGELWEMYAAWFLRGLLRIRMAISSPTPAQLTHPYIGLRLYQAGALPAHTYMTVLMSKCVKSHLVIRYHPRSLRAGGLVMCKSPLLAATLLLFIRMCLILIPMPTIITETDRDLSTALYLPDAAGDLTSISNFKPFI